MSLLIPIVILASLEARNRRDREERDRRDRDDKDRRQRDADSRDRRRASRDAFRERMNRR